MLRSLFDLASDEAAHILQVIVVNYEDKHTTMEAPDDQDEISYRCLHCLPKPSC
jgi:hypothetical protein